LSKIGVIADIHGNLPALKKALDILEAAYVDRIVVCGDIVGYGSFPNECCARIRTLNCPVVAGNHDWAVAGLTEYKESHSITAAKGIDYTKEVISEENLRWLQSLPLRHRENGLEFVHSSLVKGEKWYYLTSHRLSLHSFQQDVRESFSALKGQVCFVGHSHLPRMFLEKQEGEIEVIDPHRAFYELKDHRSIIDTGSVGLPRNRSKQASLVMLDTDHQRVYFENFTIGDTPNHSHQPAKKKAVFGKIIRKLIGRWF
jgi:predicted phosphodiesterase